MGAGRGQGPNFTPIGATCRSCGAKKTQNRPLSKLNTGGLRNLKCGTNSANFCENC